MRRIAMLAAGGRKWPNIGAPAYDMGRWGGYYIWARCGFDMQLLPQDMALCSEFAHPSRLSDCKRVSDVLERTDGVLWWRVCGSGWFMDFDASSPDTASVKRFEAYLAEKGF